MIKIISFVKFYVEYFTKELPYSILKIKNNNKNKFKIVGST